MQIYQRFDHARDIEPRHSIVKHAPVNVVTMQDSKYIGRRTERLEHTLAVPGQCQLIINHNRSNVRKTRDGQTDRQTDGHQTLLYAFHGEHGQHNNYRPIVYTKKTTQH